MIPALARSVRPYLGTICALVIFAGSMVPVAVDAQQRSSAPLPDHPSFVDILELEFPLSPRISPDGRRVAYSHVRPRVHGDRAPTQLVVWTEGQGSRTVATDEDGGIGGKRWMPGGDTLAWLAHDEEGPVLRLRSVEDVGTGRDVPLGVHGAEGFALGPRGRQALLYVSETSDRSERIEELYGRFEVAGSTPSPRHLWLLSLEDGSLRRLTEGSFTVHEAVWSPTRAEVAVVYGPPGTANNWWRRDLALLDLATGEMSPLAHGPGADDQPVWSPDGDTIAFVLAGPDTITSAAPRLAVVPRTGGPLRFLADTLTRRPLPRAWDATGLHIRLQHRTDIQLYTVTPERSLHLEPRTPAETILWMDHVVAGAAAYVAFSADGLAEVYRVAGTDNQVAAITDYSDQLRGWPVGSREMVGWTAPGGTPVEGVLHKPDGFDPTRRYPLLVIIHGGPRATSFPRLTPNQGVYPVLHFLWKGALVLEPNYRGSIGYGEDFRELHYRSLGRGDGSDVVSGVEALVDRGWVDPDRVGVMGWSYGGFLSAWVSITTDVFRAASVGAGISDWRIHYAWEPNHLTTRFYSFGATPWEDPEAYAAASPLTHIESASTPTLIQHVSGDPIVPALGARALYRGLVENGVEARLILFPGQGHGIGDLRQRLGGLWQNWRWFLRHLWDEEVEIPVG